MPDAPSADRALVAHALPGVGGRAAEQLPALDGLRGAATLAVVLYHWALVCGVPVVLGRVFALGWTGVDLFFVLSGYLITTHLLEHRAAPRYDSAVFARRLLRSR